MAAAAINLRLARAQDARSIAAMSRDLIEAGLGWKYDSRRVEQLIADRDILTLAACDRLGLVGFASMQFGDERAHLLLLAVRARSQRQGVARRLMQWLIESAHVAGIGEIGLELRAGNDAARAFYRALGFTEAGQVNGYYRERESALRMRCELRSPLGTIAPWRPPTLRRS